MGKLNGIGVLALFWGAAALAQEQGGTAAGGSPPSEVASPDSSGAVLFHDQATIDSWIRTLRSRTTARQCPGLFADSTGHQISFSGANGGADQRCFESLSQALAIAPAGLAAAKRDLWATLPPSVARFVSEGCAAATGSARERADCPLRRIRQAQQLQNAYRAGDLRLQPPTCAAIRQSLGLAPLPGLNGPVSAAECAPGGPPFPSQWDPSRSEAAVARWGSIRDLDDWLSTQCVLSSGWAGRAGRRGSGTQLTRPDENVAGFQTLLASTRQRGQCQGGSLLGNPDYGCSIQGLDRTRFPCRSSLPGSLQPVAPAPGFEADRESGWMQARYEREPFGLQVVSDGTPFQANQAALDFFRRGCGQEAVDQTGVGCIPNVPAGQPIEDFTRAQIDLVGPSVAQEVGRFYVGRLRDRLRKMACSGGVSPEAIREANQDLAACGVSSLGIQLDADSNPETSILQSCVGARSTAELPAAVGREARRVFRSATEFKLLQRALAGVRADLGDRTPLEAESRSVIERRGRLNCGAAFFTDPLTGRVAISGLRSIRFAPDRSVSLSCSLRGSLSYSEHSGDSDADLQSRFVRLQGGENVDSCRDEASEGTLSYNEAIRVCRRLARTAQALEARIGELQREEPRLQNSTLMSQVTGDVAGFTRWFGQHNSESGPPEAERLFRVAINEVRGQCFQPSCAQPRMENYLRTASSALYSTLIENTPSAPRCQSEITDLRRRPLLGGGNSPAVRRSLLGRNLNFDQGEVGEALSQGWWNDQGTIGLVPPSVLHEYTSRHPDRAWVLCQMRRRITTGGALIDGAIFTAITAGSMGMGAVAAGTGRVALAFSLAEAGTGAYFGADSLATTGGQLVRLARATNFLGAEVNDFEVQGDTAVAATLGETTVADATRSANDADERAGELLSGVGQNIVGFMAGSAFGGHLGRQRSDPSADVRARLSSLDGVGLSAEANRLHSAVAELRGRIELEEAADPAASRTSSRVTQMRRALADLQQVTEDLSSGTGNRVDHLVTAHQIFDRVELHDALVESGSAERRLHEVYRTRMGARSIRLTEAETAAIRAEMQAHPREGDDFLLSIDGSPRRFRVVTSGGMNDLSVAPVSASGELGAVRRLNAQQFEGSFPRPIVENSRSQLRTALRLDAETYRNFGEAVAAMQEGTNRQSEAAHRRVAEATVARLRRQGVQAGIECNGTCKVVVSGDIAPGPARTNLGRMATRLRRDGISLEFDTSLLVGKEGAGAYFYPGRAVVMNWGDLHPQPTSANTLHELRHFSTWRENTRFGRAMVEVNRRAARLDGMLDPGDRLELRLPGSEAFESVTYRGFRNAAASGNPPDYRLMLRSESGRDFEILPSAYNGSERRLPASMQPERAPPPNLQIEPRALSATQHSELTEVYSNSFSTDESNAYLFEGYVQMRRVSQFRRGGLQAESNQAFVDAEFRAHYAGLFLDVQEPRIRAALAGLDAGRVWSGTSGLVISAGEQGEVIIPRATLGGRDDLAVARRILVDSQARFTAQRAQLGHLRSQLASLRSGANR